MFGTYNKIESIEQVKENDILFYAVSKREILNNDFNRIRKSLEILKEAGKDAKGKLFLTFDGYDNDKREIYMIPEIRNFVKNVWDDYKFLFYFLTSFDNNRAIIFACLNDFKAIKNHKLWKNLQLKNKQSMLWKNMDF